MFKYALDDNQSLESLYAKLDVVAQEGAVSDAARYVWEKIKNFCTRVTTFFTEIWNRIFARRKHIEEKCTALPQKISQIKPDDLKKRLAQPVNKASTEAFNPDSRGCFVVPKDEMLRVLADIDKATAFINEFGSKFIAGVKQANPSGKLASATETELPEIETRLDELMDEKRVRTQIADRFNSTCPTLRMNLNDTFVVTQDTIQVLWNTPPNKGDGTYAELGYRTEADVKQVCDAFVASVKKGYNNRDKQYIDELYNIKNEVQRQESANNATQDDLSKKKAKLYSRIIDWLMMLRKMTIILDKEQISLIENCYGSLNRLTVSVPTTWNWRG